MVTAIDINTDGRFDDSSADLSGGRAVMLAETRVGAASNGPTSALGRSVAVIITAVAAGRPTPTGTVGLFDGTARLWTTPFSGRGATLRVGPPTILVGDTSNSPIQGSSVVILSSKASGTGAGGH